MTELHDLLARAAGESGPPTAALVLADVARGRRALRRRRRLTGAAAAGVAATAAAVLPLGMHSLTDAGPRRPQPASTPTDSGTWRPDGPAMAMETRADGSVMTWGMAWSRGSVGNTPGVSTTRFTLSGPPSSTTCSAPCSQTAGSAVAVTTGKVLRVYVKLAKPVDGRHWLMMTFPASSGITQSDAIKVAASMSSLGYVDGKGS